MNPVVLNLKNQESLKVIGLLQFNKKTRLEIRQENSAIALIGVSALLLHQITWEYKRQQYLDANPELLNKSLEQMRSGIKEQLSKQGYIVKDLPMNYWQAQAAYRKKDVRLRDVDALLNLQIKRIGYYTGSPFKPYRPGVILMADLVSTKGRKQLSSHVYNIGFDADDLSLFMLQLNYVTSIPVADRKYSYRNFNALMSDAKQSAVGLESVVRVAAKSVSDDLKKRVERTDLVSNQGP
jgi:hypothetical protein